MNIGNINNNRNLLHVTRTLNSLNPLGDESDNERSASRKRHNNSGGSSKNNSKTRKISNGNDKEQIILKTLNLEQRKRLIKQH